MELMPLEERIKRLREEQKKAEESNNPIKAAELSMKILKLQKGVE